MLDPNEGIIYDNIYRISKLVGGAHVHAWKVKIKGNGEIIGGAARIPTAYFRYPLFKLIYSINVLTLS